MGAMGHHERTYTFVQTEIDYGLAEGGDDKATWDADAWIGGDRNKLWFKSEGETEDGELEQAELQALYSRNIYTFFDAQVGLRHDFEPRGTTYLAFGVQGLAPYLLETDLAGFISQDGDASARFEQSVDVLLTQRLILEPHLEIELQFQDVPRRDVAAGFTDIEAGLQLRYEITRKLAPYMNVEYVRSLGETAERRGDRGEDVDGWAVRAGLRSWF
jgi:copper resistance protein B